MRESVQQNLAQYIGQEIARLREKQGLRQDQMAKQVQLSRTSISNIERGEHVPTLWVLYRICQALGVEVAEVLPRQDFVFSGKKGEASDIQNPLLMTALEHARQKVSLEEQKNEHEE